MSEEPDGFTFGAHATPDRIWVQHEGPGEERQWFTADACGGDRRELPAGFRLSLFRSWENLACDTERNELYRVDGRLLPLGGPIARQVNCWFKQTRDFGLTFRVDTREVLRVTDSAVEPLGLFLPETPEDWRTSWGDGLMDGSDDSVFVVSRGGLHEVRLDSVSTVVDERVAWVSAGFASRSERPRWLLLWEASPYDTPEEGAVPRLLDLASGQQRPLLTTAVPRLDPPWLWTSSSAIQVERDHEYAIPDQWEVHAFIDSNRLLLWRKDTESSSVWTPETESQIELTSVGRPWARPEGAQVMENGRRWIYPYDGSPPYIVESSQPPFAKSLTIGDLVAGLTETGDLVEHDIASNRTTTLDRGVTDVHPTIFKHPDSPPIVFYEKPDGELSGLWSVKLE